jgi:hypothetical protein
MSQSSVLRSPLRCCAARTICRASHRTFTQCTSQHRLRHGIARDSPLGSCFFAARRCAFPLPLLPLLLWRGAACALCLCGGASDVSRCTVTIERVTQAISGAAFARLTASTSQHAITALASPLPFSCRRRDAFLCRCCCGRGVPLPLVPRCFCGGASDTNQPKSRHHPRKPCPVLPSHASQASTASTSEHEPVRHFLFTALAASRVLCRLPPPLVPPPPCAFLAAVAAGVLWLLGGAAVPVVFAVASQMQRANVQSVAERASNMSHLRCCCSCLHTFCLAASRHAHPPARPAPLLLLSLFAPPCSLRPPPPSPPPAPPPPPRHANIALRLASRSLPTVLLYRPLSSFAISSPPLSVPLLLCHPTVLPRVTQNTKHHFRLAALPFHHPTVLPCSTQRTGTISGSPPFHHPTVLPRYSTPPLHHPTVLPRTTSCPPLLPSTTRQFLNATQRTRHHLRLSSLLPPGKFLPHGWNAQGNVTIPHHNLHKLDTSTVAPSLLPRAYALSTSSTPPHPRVYLLFHLCPHPNYHGSSKTFQI